MNNSVASYSAWHPQFKGGRTQGGAVDAALEYAAAGMPVFPVRHDKRPATKHGFKDATCDSEQIRAWWQKDPTQLIGVPTGALTDMIAIDLDVDTEKNIDGISAFSVVVEKKGTVTRTRTHRTPSGGMHLLYKYPGETVKSTAGKVGKGIDTRGDGGYIIMPPSQNGGAAYRVERDADPAPLPGWLVEIFRSHGVMSGNGDKKAAERRSKHVDASPGIPYAVASIMASGAPEGQRNDTAFRLAVLLRDEGHDQCAVKGHLTDFNRKCLPPLPDEEIETVVKSAFSRPPREPTTAPGGKIDNRAKTSPENGAKGGRPSAPPTSGVAENIFSQHFRDPHGCRRLVHWRDRWYRFNDGWSDVSDGEIEKTVISELQNDPALRQFASRNYVRNIMANLASFNNAGVDARVERPIWLSHNEDARNWIAFSNGIAVDVWRYAEQLAAGKMPSNFTRQVSPDLFSNDFVSYPWDDNDIPDLFLEYLDRVQPDVENQTAIRQMMGLLLADTGKYEVFWQLSGDGSNGKTVLLDVIESLVGSRNVSRVPLEGLAPGTRFQTFPLADSKVNICGELATDTGRATLQMIEGAFKHAVSGGEIEIERKNTDKFIARCRARFVMSANSLPTFVDRSDAIWRRLRIIPFPVQIPESERDVDLAKKIIASELPAICVWALDGLAEIIKAGRVPDCQAGDDQKRAHRDKCDHERMFLNENFEQGKNNDRIASAELYNEYRNWMEDNGYRAMGSGKFMDRITSLFPAAEHKTMRIDGGPQKGVSGIRRLNVTDVTIPQQDYG